MKQSFTLIELIVVIAIIAVLAAIIAPNAFRAIEKAKISEGITDFKTYKAATLALYADTGHWVTETAPLRPPAYYDIFLESDNNNLSTNLSNWTGWDGPYVQKIKSRHPWGGWYVFQSWNAGKGANYDIWLDFEDDCYPRPMGSQGCPVPIESAQKIDKMLDDGDLCNGDIRTGAAAGQVPGDLSWIIYWDAYAFSPP
jgi:prepilin-type N-terminal cleavage/methylation domain-containing protein